MHEYNCKCPVCGKEFVLVALFCFVPRMLRGSDGFDRVAHTCGNHTAKELRKAYRA